MPGGTGVPTPTLLTGMLTAVAAGGFVGWALVPLPVRVAGVPVFAVAAVATTLWAGLAFLRRALPSGVLAEGFHLMAVAVLAQPAAMLLADVEGPATGAGPGGVFVTLLVASVVAGLLAAGGWRLDTRARKIRLRRARRRLRAEFSWRARGAPTAGTGNGDPASGPSGSAPTSRTAGKADADVVRTRTSRR